MGTRQYKYRRSDFRPLPVRLEHLTINISFFEDRVEASEMMFLTARESLDSLVLDACDLKLRTVTMLRPSETPLKYSYRRKKNRLIIQFPSTVETGQTVVLKIEAGSTPSDNILEGIYRDTSRAGCPQQYMSQCQQWGFQRILPILDDCTAKCTMITTLEGDARYTHLISNGNISKTLNPDGIPVPKPDDPSRKQITYENMIPMAPYLFIACAGTWETLRDEVVYPSGRKVALEYLVPPGRLSDVSAPMKILKDSILWHAETQDYEYNRDVYRTICMEKSNFGGMENVGNTTIVSDAAMIDEFTGDSRLQYAHGVIIHEFEHNQCGSDVTMETPFDVWLNEAFTVDVERQYSEARFNSVRMRLEEVSGIRAPSGGPLSVEDAGHFGNIVRKGFNHPDELIDSITYVKAAEVIRMLRILIGAETFRKAKNLYFQRYNGSNANTDQFFACFEETSGRDLSQFKKQWLFTIGYPKVTGAWKYSKRLRTLTLSLKQKRQGKGGNFHIPVSVAAVDKEGKDIPATVRIIELTGSRTKITIKDVPEPAFVSWNRDYSFYGTFQEENESKDRIRVQIKSDPNHFNRVEAMRQMTDAERTRLVKEPSASPDPEWLDLYGKILQDSSLPPGMHTKLLAIDELGQNRDLVPFFRERFLARQRLLRAVAAAHKDKMLELFHATDTYVRDPNAWDGIERRQLKGVLLRALIELDTPEIQQIAEAHFRKAWNISDRMSALICLNISSHPDRLPILDECFQTWHSNVSSYSTYLAVVASGLRDDTFDLIAREEARSCFHIGHPSHSRPLFLNAGANHGILWNARGMQWIADAVIKLASINDYTAMKLVNTLQFAHKLPADLKPLAAEALRTMHDKVSTEKSPATAGRIQLYMESIKK
jgi:aminopeptidase N